MSARRQRPPPARRTQNATAALEPCRLDRLAFALWRPWILVLAGAFLLAPSRWLAAALSSGASFITMEPGARPAAMGGAYTAVAEDVHALHYNPGGLAGLARPEIGATHTNWLLDSTFDALAYAHPTRFGTFGLGVTRLAAGGAEGRDASRRSSEGFQASDTALSLGLSRTIRRGRLGPLGEGSTSLGASVKRLESRLGSHSASTLALDLGTAHALARRPYTVGASVLNFGRGMRFMEQEDTLPLTVCAGVAYRFAGAMHLALDVRHEVHDAGTTAGIGSEYALFPALTLRAGYGSQLLETTRGGGGSPLGGITGGLGLKMSNYRADYTFSPFGQGLGDVQRISVGAAF